MSTAQQMITIGLVILGTVITRFLPFLLFPDNKPTPGYVQYLGKVLPYAAIGLLVVYCLKGVELMHYPYGAAEILGVLAVGVLHVWKKNLFLSISVGTVVYMILVQAVF